MAELPLTGLVCAQQSSRYVSNIVKRAILVFMYDLNLGNVSSDYL